MSFKYVQAMTINGLTTREELEHLGNLCEEIPKEGWIFELGTFNGRSTAVLCLATNAKRVVSVDNYKMQHHGPNSVEASRRNLADIGLFPTLLVGETTQAFTDTGPNSVAGLFIDSHHHPDTFRKEMKVYGPSLRKGAIVAVHDMGRPEYPGFTEGVQDYFKDPRWRGEGRVGALEAWRLIKPWE